MKIGLGIGIPKRQSSSGGGSSFDNDYQALLDAASGDLPSASVQTAQNTLVVDLKAVGVWDKLDLFYVFATDGGNDIRRRNWKVPASFQATLVNAPTFTSLEGYTGNASNMAINTNWNPSTNGVNYTQNNASMGVYQRSNTNGTYEVFGARDASSANRIISVWNRGSEFVGMNSNSSFNIDPSLTASGLNYLDRNDSANTEIFSNGSQFTTFSDTSTGLSSSDVYILANNINGSINNHSPDQVSIFFAGASLVSEAAAFFTAVEKYMDAIGKGVVA